MQLTLVLGTPKDTLRDALRDRGVRTNAYFDVLWPQVVVAAPPRALDVVIATAADLGLPDGATLDALLAHVAPLGLGPCPLEAAAVLRLVLGASPGRITVVSPRVTPDEAAPRGFYLRNDDDGAWLRAFIASDNWCFDADERFALGVVGPTAPHPLPDQSADPPVSGRISASPGPTLRRFV
jgi:hypothetical protein